LHDGKFESKAFGQSSRHATRSSTLRAHHDLLRCCRRWLRFRANHSQAWWARSLPFGRNRPNLGPRLAHSNPHKPQIDNARLERKRGAPFASIGNEAEANLTGGWYARLDAALENHSLRVIDPSGENRDARAAFALRASLGAGKRF
jgi:hypothetical protein